MITQASPPPLSPRALVAYGASVVTALALASGCGCSKDTPPAPRPREAAVPHTRFEGVEYLGRTTISGRATDLSPATPPLEDGTPANRFGAFGSAIAWTGADERYLAASDRGPADGGTNYRCRWHEVEIRVRPGTATPVSFELRATVLLTDTEGRPFVGSSSALAPTAANAGRLDPEGLSVARDGSVWISDEYGPSLLQFDRTGRLLRRIEPPLAFRVERPQGDARDELQLNARGRTPNRGFEGLAIVDDGAVLACLTQGPLIQDGAAKGLVCRLLELTLADGSTRQRAVPLDVMRGSFNDLVAYAPQRFLTLERDAESGELRRTRRIVALDLSAAEDIADRERVTSVDSVQCARKTLVCDLLDARWGLDLATLPDKIEAMCLGPDLADGRRLVLLVSDNDMVADEASVVWAFAIDRERLER